MIKKEFTNTVLKIKPARGEFFLTHWCNTVEHVCGTEVIFDLKEIDKISEQLINSFKAEYSLELEYLQSVLESVEVVSIVKCEYNDD